jgi:hypothetical protein
MRRSIMQENVEVFRATTEEVIDHPRYKTIGQTILASGHKLERKDPLIIKGLTACTGSLCAKTDKGRKIIIGNILPLPRQVAFA